MSGPIARLALVCCLAALAVRPPILANVDLYTADQVHALTRALDSCHGEHRLNVIRALGAMGARARPAVPRLLRLLEEAQDVGDPAEADRVLQATFAALARCRLHTPAPGQAFRLAGFAYDPSTLGQTAGDYSVTFDWGDGSSAPGLVRPTRMAALYRVTPAVAHVYAEAGTYSARIVVTDRPNNVTSMFPLHVRVPGGTAAAHGRRAPRRPEDVAAAFADALRDLKRPDPAPRREAIRAVNRLVYEVPLMPLDRDARPVDAALEAAVRKGIRVAAPALAAALDDTDAFVREQAALLLRWADADAAPAVPRLAAILRRKDTPAPMAHAVLSTLDWLGPRAAPAADAVLAVLDTTNARHPDLRIEAVHTLVHMGAPAPPAVAALVRLLDDPDLAVRANAAVALGDLKVHTKPVVRKLTRMLETVDRVEPAEPAFQLRYALTRTLDVLGPAAADAVPVLVRMLEGAHRQWARAGVMEYRGMQDGATIDRAIEAVGQIGPDAGAAAPALEAFAAADHGRSVRARSAARSLEAIRGRGASR